MHKGSGMQSFTCRRPPNIVGCHVLFSVFWLCSIFLHFFVCVSTRSVCRHRCRRRRRPWEIEQTLPHSRSRSREREREQCRHRTVYIYISPSCDSELLLRQGREERVGHQTNSASELNRLIDRLIKKRSRKKKKKKKTKNSCPVYKRWRLSV